MEALLLILMNEVQIVTLLFMAILYIGRIVWLFKFRPPKEISHKMGVPQIGIIYSLLNIFMPWTMESVRKNPWLYIQFVIMHIGIFLAILASFLIPLGPMIFQYVLIVKVFQLAMLLGSMVALYRLVRRIVDPRIRMISIPDDYFALILVIGFLVSGISAVTMTIGPLIVFFSITALFHIYAPFSKIIHYLCYPFTRYFFGKSMGHRGVFAKKRIV